MKTISSWALHCISLLYIVLFVYAAITKVLDFENFRVQLSQSPLVTPFAGVLAILVPALEVIIAVLIAVPRLKGYGFLAGYGLMAAFSVYIFVMLEFSPEVPCSCGGILEAMGWWEHLVFNLVVTALGIVGVFLSLFKGFPKPIIAASITGLMAIVLVGILFYLSDDMIRRRNPFVRRFAKAAAQFEKDRDLGVNSYYFAGFDNGRIYLGNSTAPLNLLVLDNNLNILEQRTLSLPQSKYVMKAPKLLVTRGRFYLYDGTAAVAYTGTTDDWMATPVSEGELYFSALVPISDTRYAFTALSSRTHTNTLGLLEPGDPGVIAYKDGLLTRQVDGVFDTDGQLLYNEKTGKLVYLHYYRNRFIVADTTMTIIHRGKTIDTVSHAAFKVAPVKGGRQTKIASPALVVNKAMATGGKYLFVNSGIIGKYEPRSMWEQSAIIDAYDLNDRSYAFSFYFYDHGGSRLRQFRINGDIVLGLAGNYIVKYTLKTPYYKD